MREPVFTGVCTALVTPFHESGSIDFDAFSAQIQRQLDSGADALCVCGTTGESPTLSKQEWQDAVLFCIREVRGRVKVIAGTGTNCTETSLERTRFAQDHGADAALLVTPYYNKTTQEGLVRHYEYVAQRTQIPLILYNVPSRTGLSFTAETYARLAQLETINGVKEASGDFTLFTKTRTRCGDDFHIWSGSDELTLPFRTMGAVGVISAAANVIPEVMVSICKSDLNSAAKLQLQYANLLDALFSEVNPIAIKYAMQLIGLDSGVLRLPLTPISRENGNKVRAALQQLNLL